MQTEQPTPEGVSKVRALVLALAIAAMVSTAFPRVAVAPQDLYRRSGKDGFLGRDAQEDRVAVSGAHRGRVFAGSRRPVGRRQHVLQQTSGSSRDRESRRRVYVEHRKTGIPQTRSRLGGRFPGPGESGGKRPRPSGNSRMGIRPLNCGRGPSRQ